MARSWLRNMQTSGSLYFSKYLERNHCQTQYDTGYQRIGFWPIFSEVVLIRWFRGLPVAKLIPKNYRSLVAVAEKYNLYTKITGGQRVDIAGARVDQLPQIWKELIDEGFESGHAYGKSLRTVKSCVGSTWCRFGLHDSVSFAIEIEERYKGLRAPHKIKGGVSGCIRECAEARGKDFGVIATDKGWNLYVCGNGGANPAHAVLLANDIDKETLIKYLDRFLMYYIKTAELIDTNLKMAITSMAASNILKMW